MMSSEGVPSLVDRLIRFFLEQKLVAVLLGLVLFGWGIAVAPFDWDTGILPRSPVPVDAIPDLGENQQIVFTEWAGRSPRDVEDQLTYPLTVALLGVPGVREVRSASMFGFSSIFVIFEEDVEFYWSRSRILERLSSLPSGTIPDGAQPVLGPDATGLGQIFWYTLEGQDPAGKPAGGWDLQELRSIQDWYVRYGLQSAAGVSEVASIGGHVAEYQVDVHPEKLRIHGVTLGQVMDAVRKSHLDVGARSTEINRVEYLIRGLGLVKTVEDLELATVRLAPDNTPIRIRDVATVTRGPAERRGVLTLGGAEAVGGVVVVRQGFNPLEALRNVHDRIEELSPGLASKALVQWEKTNIREVHAFAEAQRLPLPAVDGTLEQAAWRGWLRQHDLEQWPEWLTLSTVSIVPFYDRTTLINETLGTLNDALVQQVLVTIIVVVVMVLHLRAAIVISSLLPLSVLSAFILMRIFGVDANVVALAGIAIAIGTIVDMGIIMTENVLRHLQVSEEGGKGRSKGSAFNLVYRASCEVGGAILTAISTTIVSFLPVFTMTGAEGKMFLPLAYTKTFVLFASVVISLTILPCLIHVLIVRRWDSQQSRRLLWFGLGCVGIVLFVVGLKEGWAMVWSIALLLVLVSLLRLIQPWWWNKLPAELRDRISDVGRASVVRYLPVVVASIAVTWLLSGLWEPLGPERGRFLNFLFVLLLMGSLLSAVFLLERVYEPVLQWAIRHKVLFLLLPLSVTLFGATVWLGFGKVFRFVPATVSSVGGQEAWVTHSRFWVWASHEFTGLGREFMPALDEGAFLWMPTMMPHASIGEALEVLQYQDQAIAGIPEVDTVVGKIGRAETALDPAPVSMIETVILYKSEYVTDAKGRRINFLYNRDKQAFERNALGELIPDPTGRPFRQWRDSIRTPQDIWDEIAKAAHIPGTTSAPKLQPIETRLVMLQTGMRAPMGLKLRGPNLETLDRMAVELEGLLREVPQVASDTVNADRVVGKPYLEVELDRVALSRFGLNVADVQEVLSTAIGGQVVGTTIEGRERYPIRVRYPREERNTMEAIEATLIDIPGGGSLPLREVAQVNYVRGPQMIQSEDTFLVAYITFGGREGFSEVEVVEAAEAYLSARIDSGELAVPAGVSWRFAGTYEHQQHAEQTLAVILPVALALIFMILYFQFRSVSITLIVCSSILVATGGGFTMLYLYSQPWFLDFPLFGVNMRDLFQLQAINLSVAVWVGFLALFGIAVDDGVIMATYLNQSFRRNRPDTLAEVRDAVVQGSLRRVRPCLMTTATTVLALLPVLTATGRGADIMIPMALPSIGGMFFVLLSLFSIPVLYAWIEEQKLR